jgi:phage shock protein PspC (stress-responsive transcriptional regulator)
MRDENGHRTLVRPRKGRMLAGVCAGVADYFSVDVTLIRVIWAVVSVVSGGVGLLAYLVAWAIMPEQEEKDSVAEDMTGKERDARPV